MDLDRPARTPWHDFPDVLIHAEESVVKKNANYPAAKAGDVPAARRLVESTLSEEMLAILDSRLAGSNALIASVHAYEAEGINRIPAVLAEVLAERLGLHAEESVVQTNRSGHTGAGGYHRLGHPALFGGDVERDREDLLVDDFVGQGGTIANLKGFVESQGRFALLAVVSQFGCHAGSGAWLRAVKWAHGYATQKTTRPEPACEADRRYIYRSDSTARPKWRQEQPRGISRPHGRLEGRPGSRCEAFKTGENKSGAIGRSRSVAQE